mmetsp:Transcript_77166/g.236120  ORF Transcript_77166/g.236120 Transcript_77166/m.236120 type:complete len:209 (+) Transcript_77166:359-985(+)
MALAATRPWLVATSQCSTRSGVPVRGARYVATSPAAKRPSAEVCKHSSVTSDPSRAFSAPDTNAALGITPTPTTTPSQRNFCPDFNDTVRPPAAASWISLQMAGPTNLMPLDSKNLLMASPTRRPSTRSKGTASIPRTVTSQPRRASVAAISMPIKDEPTTSTCLPLVQVAAMRCASSGVRNANTLGKSPPGTGSFLGFAPVATSALS